VAQATSAQTATPAGAAKKIPAYDVVSIKPNNSGPNHLSITVDDGNFTAENVDLATLIQDAYGYKRDQIIGLDGSISSARFDIRAKVLDPDIKALDALSGAERGSMLRAILIERFHLKFHTEMRELSVYELLQAKGGSKLVQTSAVDKGEGDKKEFHGVSSGSTSVHGTRAGVEMIAHDVPMPTLVTNLSSNLRRVVIDKTGLTGKYDIWLRWSREDLSASMDKTTDNGSQAEVLPTLFTALQEQLGLRLQGSKDPVETMVIDGLDMPSAD
jgi:uncharacterized protein (TIGR03435 family)